MVERKPVIEFAAVGAGQGAPQREEDFAPEGTPFIRASSLELLLNGTAEFDLEKVPAQTAKKYGLRTYPAGTVVFAKSGMSAKKERVYKLRGECHVVNHLCTLLPHEHTDPDYLVYALRAHPPASLIKDDAYPSITQTQVERFKIPWFELDDQRRIAALLSRAEGLIAQRKESLRLLDELVRSVFLEMFGDPSMNEKQWPVRHLEDMASDIVDCPHSTPEISEGPTAFACIRTSELREGYIFWPSMRYVDEDIYKVRTKRLVPQRGDIVYGREGSFGEAVRLPFSPKFCLGQRTMLIRPDRKVCSGTYLWAALRSEYGYHQALRKNSGSTVGHVNVKDIRKFKFPCPPVTTQRHFSSVVQSIDNLREKLAESQIELEQLYGSLSQRAFRGELDVSRVGLIPPEVAHLDKRPFIVLPATVPGGNASIGPSTQAKKTKRKQPSSATLQGGVLGKVSGEQFKPEFVEEVVNHMRVGREMFRFEDFKAAVDKLKFKFEYTDLRDAIFHAMEGDSAFLEQVFTKDEERGGFEEAAMERIMLRVKS